MNTVLAGRRAGLSRELIVKQAVQLSVISGVEGWSVRDIARESGVVPSVIYHYFPNREAICDAVVDQVCVGTEASDLDPEWKAWFRVMAYNLHSALLAYPGIIDRFARGKLNEQFLPMIDGVWARLQELPLHYFERIETN